MAENRLSTQIRHRTSLPGHFDRPVILEDVRALSGAADPARDTLGRAYEYSLARFAIGEGEGESGGRFYTSSHGSNFTTRRLAKMNLANGGIDAQIAHGVTSNNDRHPDLEADYVLANPPFNGSDWRGELLRDDQRWSYGAPPAGNANYAWRAVA